MPEIEPTREENWLAAICHWSVFLQFWGMIVPLVILLTQKDRSPRLKVQAAQALAYQCVGFLGYLFMMVLGMGLYFAILFVAIPLQLNYAHAESGFPALFIIIMALFLLVMSFFGFILVPAYYILAIVAGIQNVRKGDFRYPLLGRWIYSLVKPGGSE